MAERIAIMPSALSAWMTLLLWSLCAAPAAFAQNPQAEASIRAIIAEQAAAWNAGDGTAYAKDVKTLPAGIPVPPDGILKTQLMEVFVRRGDQWWVEAYHNVDIKPDK